MCEALSKPLQMEARLKDGLDATEVKVVDISGGIHFVEISGPSEIPALNSLHF